MADEPTGNTDIASLGLDIRHYMAELQKALSAYNKFASNFSKTLSVRLDPTSLGILSTAFGVQMRQAVAMQKNANKETVADSVKAARTIADEFKKTHGLTEASAKKTGKTFKEMTERAAADLANLANSSKVAGDKIGEALAAGAKKAKSEVQSTAAAAQQALIGTGRVAEAVNQRNYNRAEATAAQLRLMAAARAKKAGLDENEVLSKANLPATEDLLRVRDSGKGVVLDTDAKTAAVNRLKAAIQELREAKLAEAAAGGNAVPRMKQQYESLAVQLDRTTERFNRLTKAQQQAVLAGASRRFAAHAGDGQQGGTPYTQFTRVEDFARFGPRELTESGEKQAILNHSRKLNALTTEIANAERTQRDADKALRAKMAADLRAQRAAERLAAAQERAAAKQEELVNKAHAAANKMLAAEARAARALDAKSRFAAEQARQQNTNARLGAVIDSIGSSGAPLSYGQLTATGNAGGRLVPGGGRLQAPFNAKGPGGAAAGLPTVTPQNIANANQLLSVHKSIGNTIGHSLATAAKFLIVYRAFHQVAQVVERSIRAFVSAGIEYTRELETQQLALRSILSENFKITDSQGEQLRGAAALAGLRGESTRQWNEIQTAALSVVGSTADLMQLYEGILPYAARLGATLSEVQQLTKNSAVAASLLGISFQDARSAMISLLQGRALTRNKLVGALGIEKADISAVDGLERLAFLETKLRQFALASGEAQNTLAALSETFQEFTGRLATAVTVPFTDMFKEFVKGLSDGSAWSLFVKNAQTGALEIKKSVQDMMTFTQGVVKHSLSPLKQYAQILGSTSSNEMKQWVIAMGKTIETGLKFIVILTKLTLATGTFIAENRQLIAWIAKAVGISVLVNILAKVFAAFQAAARGGSVLAGVFRMLTGVSFGAGKAVNGVGQQSLFATSKMAGLKNIMTQVGKFAGFAVVTAAIFHLAQTFARLRQEANSAKAAMDALRKGDTSGVVRESQEGLNSGDISQQVNASSRLLRRGTQISAEMSGLFGGKFTPAAGFARQNAYNEEIKRLEKEREANDIKLQAAGKQAAKTPTPELAATIQKLHDANIGIGKQLTEQQARKDDLKNKMAELDQIVAELPNIIRAAENVKQSAVPVSLAGELIHFLQNPLDALAPTVKGQQQIGITGPQKEAIAKSIVQRAQALFNQSQVGKQVLVGEEEANRVKMDPILPPPEDTLAKQAPVYASYIDDEARMIEAVTRLRIEAVQTRIAAEILTEEEGQDEIAIINNEKFEQLKAAYAADKVRYQDWVDAKASYVAKDGKRRPVPEIRYDEKMYDFASRAVAMDMEEAERLQQDQTRREAAIVRNKALLSDSIRDLAKQSADLYGTVEDSALTKFDDHVKDILAKLKKIAFGAEDLAKISQLEADFAGLRPDLARDARARNTIQYSDKSLTVSNQQEDLLYKQFERGSVGATEYLRRLNNIRETQRQLLADNEQAYLTLASIKQIGIDKETDPQKRLAMGAEMAELIAKAAQARDLIDDIGNSAQRVHILLQSWSNAVGLVGQVLSAADGLNAMPAWVDNTNTGLMSLIGTLKGVLGIMGQIQQSATAFAQIPKAFEQVKGYFADAKSAFSGVGALFGKGSKVGGPGMGGIGTQLAMPGADGVASMAKAGSKMAAAIPLVGIGISAALAIGTAMFQSAVEKHKKEINKSFDLIAKNLQNGTVELGASIAAAEAERKRIVAKLSKSKSGRSALKDLLPEIDSQIEEMKLARENVLKNFDKDLQKLRMGSGVFGDFARQLLDLEEYVQNVLKSIDISTADGLRQYDETLTKVREYVNIFFRNAKAQFQEQMIGFEGEALASQERLFSLLNEKDGAYKQLRDIAEQRQSLDEAIADEQERRAKGQDKLNDLAKKELDIRKRIADVIKQAAEDELSIRRRGVMEAQLSVAQQKAMEISQVRNKAAEEIAKLQDELARLRDDIEDETKANARKDRDFARQARDLAEHEAEVRRSMRLNDIRIQGARAVAQLEGAMFGMATSEEDLLRRQNALALKSAEIQVKKWRETKGLIDGIHEKMATFEFEPPAGFPQIKVDLGSIYIDNTDASTNHFNGTGGGGTGGGGGRGRTPPGKENETGDQAVPRDETNRRQGYGDV